MTYEDRNPCPPPGAPSSGARVQLDFEVDIPTEKRFLDGQLLVLLQRLEDGFAAVSSSGGRPPPPRIDLERLRVALAEALANAAEHGNGYRSEARIRIRGRADHRGLWLEVEDEGPGFDPESTRERLRRADSRRERGRGLAFLEGLTSELRFERGGSRVVLGFLREEER